MGREKYIQDAGIQYMRLARWYVQRINSGAIPVEHRGRTRLIRMAEAGTPDTMAFRAHPSVPGAVQLVFIEYKAPGNKPTVLQQVKMQELETYGATCIVVSSLEELETALREFSRKAA